MFETCKTCKHWDVFPVDDAAAYKRGTCRRSPPTQDMVAVLERHYLGLESRSECSTDPIFWRQPSTFESDFCGEWGALATPPGDG